MSPDNDDFRNDDEVTHDDELHLERRFDRRTMSIWNDDGVQHVAHILGASLGVSAYA